MELGFLVFDLVLLLLVLLFQLVHLELVIHFLKQVNLQRGQVKYQDVQLFHEWETRLGSARFQGPERSPHREDQE